MRSRSACHTQSVHRAPCYALGSKRATRAFPTASHRGTRKRRLKARATSAQTLFVNSVWRSIRTTPSFSSKTATSRITMTGFSRFRSKFRASRHRTSPNNARQCHLTWLANKAKSQPLAKQSPSRETRRDRMEKPHWQKMQPRRLRNQQITFSCSPRQQIT